MKFRYITAALLSVLLLFSCRSVPEKNVAEAVPVPSEKDSGNSVQNAEPSFQPSLTLLFGGDIMAHRVNFSMNDYSVIWKEVKPLVRSADFSFANIESPVDDDLPCSAYPDFNMHHQYAEAAVDAGFNVFSLVNNHFNDKGYEGLVRTCGWAEKTSAAYASTDRPVFFSGISREKQTGVTYEVIRRNGWTIVFCAVTEILNRPDLKERVNYVAPADKTRKAFEQRIRDIRAQTDCDLLIVSVHSCMPEYVREVPASERAYFRALLSSGADIVWSNHPHVVLEREFTGTKRSGRLSKLIMYANGNTISGQRYDPQFSSPYGSREYTGDGLLYRVVFTKAHADSAPVLTDTQAFYITTYINTANQFVIRFLNDDFISYLKSADRPQWASYIFQRKKIMEKTKVTKTWL